MFDDVSGKIRLISKIVWWIGTVTIVGIITMWPLAYVLSGYAEMIENSAIAAYNSEKMAKMMEAPIIAKKQEEEKKRAEEQKKRAEEQKRKFQEKRQAEMMLAQKEKTIGGEENPIDVEKEKQYLFARQMLAVRNYDVARNALMKIKGYKDVDELLKNLDNN